ncbi:MAG: TonB-system energizer ExbB [Campylobacterales bacterium]|nr:TonB-system energizer ExbB [Campylobacterales bacterium]
MGELKDLVEIGTFSVLGLMGFIATFLIIERLLRYRSIKLEEYTNKDELEIELSNNLTLISTIGSNAPYVGLLGTVLGIMATFFAIGESGFVETKTIMVGLGLALKATALGLVVAIPSMIFYNLLVRKVEVLLTKWIILQDK